MAQKLIEGVIDAAVTYLTANMAAKLNALDTLYGDSIVLDDIAAFHKSQLSIESIEKFPIVVVDSDASEMLKWDNTWTDANHTVTFDVLVSDQDTETLAKRVRRHLQAVWEVLIDGVWAEQIAHLDGERPRVAYTSVFTDPSNNYLAGARLTVTFRKDEVD